MTKRDVVIDALEFRRPAYVPWHVDLTIDCRARLGEHLGVDDLSEVLDPHFVDATGLDFRLRDDSPAWKLGFETIPLEKIGLYRSQERATWPVPDSQNPAVKR